MTVTKNRRIEYLEGLALRQAQLLRELAASQQLPEPKRKAVKEAVDAAAMIRHAQAQRAARAAQLHTSAWEGFKAQYPGLTDAELESRGFVKTAGAQESEDKK